MSLFNQFSTRSPYAKCWSSDFLVCVFFFGGGSFGEGGGGGITDLTGWQRAVEPAWPTGKILTLHGWECSMPHIASYSLLLQRFYRDASFRRRARYGDGDQLPRGYFFRLDCEKRNKLKGRNRLADQAISYMHGCEYKYGHGVTLSNKTLPSQAVVAHDNQSEPAAAGG